MLKACIDIGGTNTRVAIINSEIEIVDMYIFETKTKNPALNCDILVEWLRNKTYSQINISTCGPYDFLNDMYIDVPNLELWNKFSILTYLKSKIKKDIKLENDANCAALFESKQRDNVSSLIYFTLSTGFGGGLIINNKIYSGYTNHAMEPHKYLLNINDTMEKTSSGTGLLNMVMEEYPNIKSTKEIFELAKNNKDIERLLDQWVERVIVFLNNSDSFINPEYIILGGSVITNNLDYFEKIKQKFKSISNSNVKIEIAKDKNYNALKGAYYI